MVKKVKIIEAYYEPQTDTVNWNVETPEGDTYPLCWPRSRYGECVFSIKGTIPVKMIEENCQMLRGKEFFHELRPLPKPELKDASKDVREQRVSKVSKSKKNTRKRAKNKKH